MSARKPIKRHKDQKVANDLVADVSALEPVITDQPPHLVLIDKMAEIVRAALDNHGYEVRSKPLVEIASDNFHGTAIVTARISIDMNGELKAVFDATPAA